MAMFWVVSLIYTANKPKYYGEQRRDQKKAEDGLKGTRLPAGKNVRFNFVLLAGDSRRGFSHTLDLTQLLFDGDLRKFLSLLWHISIAQKSLRPALVDQDPVSQPRILLASHVVRWSNGNTVTPWHFQSGFLEGKWLNFRGNDYFPK